MAISPTAEGFRAAFRRPSLALAEIMWRWTVGATATALFFFGLVQYLNTLPVTNGELLFLRTRQPYLVAEAIAHILRGSLSRGMIAALLAVFLMACLWMIAASVGRIATVRALIDYFHRDAADTVPAKSGTMRPLVRLNFLRASVAMAAIFGVFGAAILAGFASPDTHPRPGLAFLLFLPLAGMIGVAWWALNWVLSLAGMFAARDGEDAVGAISAAVTFCRERLGPVFAVTLWTALAHLIAFVGATVAASMPIGMAGVVPWRLVVLLVLLVTIAYFALVDWLYMVRLAGYVCIAEMPAEALVARAPAPTPPPAGLPASPEPPLQTTIDRDEPILSDVPGLA